MSEPTQGLEGLSPARRALLELRLRKAERQPVLHPLSFAQQRLWFAAQLDPDSSLYNLPSALRLTGAIDAAALARALGEIVRRHEALRTVFVAVDGRPFQQVLPPRPFVLPLVDLARVPAALSEAEVRRLTADDAARPFDLARGPLLRATLLRIGAEEHVALLGMHHIVSDGWSFRVLVGELGALYEAFRRGLPSPLPPLPIQYADYARWQRRWLEGGVLEEQLAWWRERLAGELPALQLPADRPRPAVPSERGGNASWVLPVDLADDLQRLARRAGATPFMLFLAAFEVLLYRSTGQLDLLVGTPVANRNRPELELLIGFFVNTLVLRTDLSGDPPFLELLERVRETALGAFAHQDTPFDKLVEELQPRRTLSHQPLFQVMFAMQNVPSRRLSLGEVEIETMAADDGRSKFDLTLSALEVGRTVGGGLEYSADLFDPATVQRLLERWETLLAGIAAEPARRLSDLPLLTPGERRQLLEEWNATGAPFRRDVPVHRLFEERVDEDPSRVALTFAGGVAVTYGELEERANQLAHLLLSRGVGAETVVALCLERSPEMVAALLAVLKTGGAYLPLDPAQPEQRLAQMLEQARPDLLVSRRGLLPDLQVAGVGRVRLDDEEEALASAGARRPEVAIDPGQLAYVIYTSGSSGVPKGVMVPHHGLCNVAEVQTRAFAPGPEDRVLQLFSFSFDASFWDILLALANGARLCVATGEARLPGAALEAWMKEQGVTLATLPPSLLGVLPAEELPRLRALTSTGEACPPEVVERWARGRRFFNGYGPTETTIGTTLGECVPDGRSPHIGRPFPNMRVYLLGPFPEPVPAGVPGEVFAGGVGVTRGYHRRPDLTAERFVPDPFGPQGGRLYRTGDLARFRPDGLLEFLGRVDTQVQIRGFRVEPDEVRAALVRYPGVREAAVLALEGRRGVSLVAYATPRTLAVADLRRFLQERLPDYMVPSAFVLLDALPTTANGKLDRRSLPAPPPERPDLDTLYAAPGKPSEETLVAIWAEVLRLERVGVHDNFFALGGDSILSIQVVSRAQAAGLRLSPRHLFQRQTVAELAALADELAMEAGMASAPSEGGRKTDDGPIPLTPILRWFFSLGLPAPHHWNQALFFALRQRLDPAALHRAVAALLERHEALRLRVLPAADDWRLETASAAAPPFTLLDLSAVPATERTPALEAAAAALQASLDLAAGPIFRCALFDLGEGEPARLLLVAHHLAVDGVSWRILLEELHALTVGALLQPSTTPFRRWAGRLAEHARTAAVRAELAAWSSLPSMSPLPSSPGANTEATARRVTTALAEAETRALLQEVPRAYRTRIQEVLLTALALAFAPWTGERRLLVDLEGHGREDLFEDVDLSRTVGWLTSFHPVLLEIPRGGGPGEALKAVKESLRSIPGRGIGYGLLRFGADAEVARRLVALPAAQVVFNYLGQLDQALPGDSPLVPAAESAGPLHAPENPRTHLLEIGASVAGGRLQVGWTYSESVHDAATVEALAGRFLVALRELIAHCRSAGAGGWTPSDFPRAGLPQEDLDHLRAAFGGDPGVVEDLYPLSPIQQGMLFHTLAAPGTGQYVQQLSCTVRGALDPAAFRRAWERVFARHTVLRTSFLWRHRGAPVQVVHRRLPLDWREEDWRGLPSARQEKLFAERLRSDGMGFELDRPPLMRFALLRLADGVWRFLWSSHHLLMDGWSFPLLLRELFRLYAAEVGGPQASLPESRPYGDYIDWLRRRDLAAEEAFWRSTLAGFHAPTPLGTGGAGAGDGESFGRRGLHLGEEVTARLAALGRRSRLTLGTLVQGAWALLLCRWSGEEDVLFGLTVAGRPEALPGAETMVGPFINTLPLRARAVPEAPLADWFRGLQERQAEMQGFAATPLPDIQGWSEIPRGTPLFATLLVFESYPVDTSSTSGARAGGLEITDVVTSERTNYPLTLAAVPAERLALNLTFDRARLEETEAVRLLEHLANLLVGMKEEARLVDLPLLSAAERHQLLTEWNDTAWPAPEIRLHELFAARAARTPEAPAVLSVEERWTYGDLARRAAGLARLLRARGVGEETRVGLLAERSPALLVGMLGILGAGGAYVPLDPEHPRERLAAILVDAGISLLVVPGERPLSVDLPVREVVGTDETLHETAELPVTGVALDQSAYVIYTSGSTGRPKGVVVPHRGVGNLAAAQVAAFGITSGDRILQLASPGFDASVSEIAMAWWAGAELCLAERGDLLPGPPLAHLLRERRITCVTLPPSALAEMDGEELPDLRVLIVAGEACPPALAERWAAGRRFFDAYGPTEATVCTTLGRHLPGSGALTIGRPLANARVHLVDLWGDPAPLGVPGELCVAGPGVARGYLGRPDLTAELFIPDPFGAPGARLYRTGDRARLLSDGRVDYLGRIDRQVKIRGIRIEPGEVEAALADCPGVRGAAVLPLSSPGAGTRLVAFVAGDGLAAGALRTALRERLPEPWVPAAFMVLDSLPVTPHGKVDRRALAARELPEPGRDEASGFAPPRTPIEELLAGIWIDVLGVSRVGSHDSFFDLGGHSLLATRVASRVREAFGVELPLRRLFDAPTLAGLAAVVTALRAADRSLDTPPILPGPRDGGLPLSFAQERLWFLHQLDPRGAAYNIPAAVRLTGRLDVPALAAAVGEIVRRHESLRTTFELREDGPVQRIAPRLALALPLVDLRALPEDRRTGEARWLAAAEAALPFDLVAGPLLRMALLWLGEKEQIALLTLHHIVSDGWSMGVFVRELATLYAVFVEGRPSPLPELAVQYADFARWQREWLTGETLERQLRAWRERLAGAPAVVELPADRPRPAVRSASGGYQVLSLSPQASEDLRALSRREGATLFMSLLAAFAALLGRTTGEMDLPVGSPIANRNRAETEKLIGFFVNTLVLRGDLSGDPGFRELLVRTRETALDAYADQDLPFERLVEELQPERSLSHTPLFQVMLTLQNASAGALELPGLTLEVLDTEGGAAKYDLSLTLLETAGGAVAGSFEYARDLFDPPTVERLARRFEILLAGALEAPRRRLSELPMLTGPEREQLLAPGQTPEPPAALGVHELFALQAARTPEAVAVVGHGRRISYGELDAWSSRLAGHLRRLGVAPGEVVGLCFERSPDLLATLLGVLKAGSAYLPLDPSHPAERRAALLADAGVRLLVARPEVEEALVMGRLLLDPVDLPAGEEGGTASTGPADLAYVIYTSGSTGRPKGVQVSHGALAHHAQAVARRYDLGPQDRVLQFASIAFDVAAEEIFPTWLAGGAVVLRPDGTVPAFSDLEALIAGEGLTVLNLPTSYWHEWAADLAREGRRPPSSLRLLVVGTEPALPGALALWRETVGESVRWINSYGPTEATITATIYEPGSRDRPEPRVPVGRPLGRARALVLDAFLGLLPPGSPGELCLGGPGLARGYLGRPARTAAAFVPDPYSGEAGARLYRTGDRARLLPGGDLELLGRIDRQVKIRGFRLEPGEIEAALAAHPGVREAAVAARDTAGGDRRLVAWVAMASGGGEPRPEELRAFLATHLPEPMLPAAFVILPELPRLPGGKPDLVALPAPEGGTPARNAPFRPPANDAEERLAAIWREVLGVERIGADDNFFDLGGHSLLVVRVQGRVRQAFGRDLPIVELFRHPTVASLAARLSAESAEAAAAGPGLREQARQRLERQREGQALEDRARQARLARRKGGGA